MPILDPGDARRVPERKTSTAFCDRCKTLTRVTQYRTGGGKIEWLCEEHKPSLSLQRSWYTPTPNSPPPADAVKSPELDQWITPREPADLDADIPADLLDEAIDAEIAAFDAMREAEPVGTEQPAAAHDGLTHPDRRAS